VKLLLLLFTGLGVVPLAVGVLPLLASRPAPRQWDWRLALGSALICTLAFNLVFFWQELWLVLPKALTPGLAPVLYHNDHSWRGHVPVEALLQGTGAVATLLAGITAGVALAISAAASPHDPKRSPLVPLLLFWLAFQGLFQSLSQVVIGAGLPGNDVGMAMTYLALPGALRWTAAGIAILCMALAGNRLSRLFPLGVGADSAERRRDLVRYAVLPALIAVVLTVPFRIPRNIVEVVFVPLFTAVVGSGWVLAAAATRADRPDCGSGLPLRAITLALVALLLIFQLLLRPGIRF
jgi:hypothetical protein